ncbi:MAG: hypothetical protein HZC28_01445 [Spirochaetes bacterium]|nr:hypothetical protein [Spirochaetota bacterium]
MEAYAVAKDFKPSEEKTSPSDKRKDELTDICARAVFVPRELTDKKTWKSTSATAKEIYRVLAACYDYENGLSKATHNEIQNESGIGSRATIVKALRELNSLGIITIIEVGTRTNLVRHHYLMPHQERCYASLIGAAERDFSAIYKSSERKEPKAVKRRVHFPEEIHPLFFRVCQKLLKLSVPRPERLIGLFADQGEKLRTIMFMCDASYIAHKHKVRDNGKTLASPIDTLVTHLKEGDIRDDIFGKHATDEIKSIMKSYKEKSVKR